MDMFPKAKPPKMFPRFNGPFIVTKKLDRGAVVIRLQDGTETVANLDRLEGQDSSNTLVPAQISEVDSSFHQDHEMREPEADSQLSSNIALSQDNQSRVSGSFIACEGTPKDHVQECSSYSELLHDEFPTDPELSNKEISLRGMPDPDNPGRTRM
jgi:hypothetical protein